MSTPRSSMLVRGLLALALGAATLSAQAALFGDDEARRAILELREKVEANRVATEVELKRLTDENGSLTRRGLLDLSNEVETLRAELARLRGENETLARAVAELQRQQKDVLAALDERLRAIEPAQVQLDGQTFRAQPGEQRDFEAAMALLRDSKFGAAGERFAAFLQQHPQSGYTASVLYWLGNTQYAERNYKGAIASYKRLIDEAPQHLRAPEAMLAMANCEIELKSSKGARQTLERLVKTYPQSEAAAAAKDRLARLR